MFGSLDIGSAVGLVVCGPLINAAGWPAVFYLFGALGLLWCAGWPLLKPESQDSTVEPIVQPQHKGAGERLVGHVSQVGRLCKALGRGRQSSHVKRGLRHPIEQGAD